MEVKDYIEIGIGAYLSGEAFKGCLGPTKKHLEEAKIKAIEKRKKPLEFIGRLVNCGRNIMTRNVT